jgi:hypothetical protein
MQSIIIWLKSNWIWILIIPGVFYAIMKFAKYLVIAYDLELGFPYVIRKKQKELENNINEIKENLNDKIKDINDKRDEKWKEVTSGEKNPSDIFNDLLGKK